MKNVLAAIIVIALFVAASIAQKTDDKQAVLGVVNQLFVEMGAANPAGILATGTAENQLVAVRKLKNGKSRIDVIGGEAFSKLFIDKTKAYEEVMYSPNVEVSGDWAMVWGRYVFFAGGKLSHCGINQFNLVRTETGGRSRTEHR